MSTEDTSPSTSDVITAAAFRNGRVKPPDTSKGETWDGQMKAALDALRSKNRKAATTKDVKGAETTPVHDTDSGELDQTLDPFTMNDLIRKGFRR